MEVKNYTHLFVNQAIEHFCEKLIDEGLSTEELLEMVPLEIMEKMIRKRALCPLKKCQFCREILDLEIYDLQKRKERVCPKEK